MKILLTGGTGAVGRNLLRQWIAEGKHDLIATSRSAQVIEPAIHSGLQLERGDLNDPTFLRSLFERHRPDAVVHCAWQGVKGAERNDVIQLQNFITFTNLVEAAAKAGCKVFVGLGSQAEYGIHNKEIDEDTTTKPQSRYGVFKLAAGHFGRQVARESGMKYAWLRLFASYGPFDHPEFLIPYVTEKFLCNESPELSHGDQLWDYLYVDDVVTAIRTIVQSNRDFNDIYNLSSGRPVRVRDIVMKLKQITGTSAEPGFGRIHSQSELYLLHGNNNKLRSTFELPEQTSLEKGLSLNVEWHRQNKLNPSTNS